MSILAAIVAGIQLLGVIVAAWINHSDRINKAVDEIDAQIKEAEKTNDQEKMSHLINRRNAIK